MLRVGLDIAVHSQISTRIRMPPLQGLPILLFIKRRVPQRRLLTLLIFPIFSSTASQFLIYLCLSGKAEAGSAGEQPARNSLIRLEWSKVEVKCFDLFLCTFQEADASKNSILPNFELQKTCFYQQYKVCISVSIFYEWAVAD